MSKVAAQEEKQTMSIKQKILMPGPLISGHAKYETQCDACHSSFAKEEKTTLCLDCHEEISEDRNTKKGFHGQWSLAANNSCDTCHTDHEGRDADILGILPESFDHVDTRFPLQGIHKSTVCESCHKPGKKFREASSQCVDCHGSDDVHNGVLGEQCSDCHHPRSWQQLLPFDHDETDFPLRGQHQKLSCSSCHIGQQFEFLRTGCVDCHKSSDIHGGSNGDQCDSCHSVEGWDQVDFNHADTEFPLIGKHDDIPCNACHVDGLDAKETPKTCVACHANEDVHLGRNGEQCENCHNTVRWQKLIFNHQKDTDFPLTGQHADLSCTQCHAGSVHDPLPRDCASCHAADDIHNDPEMQLCATCHNTNDWKVITKFDHDFTSFPLNGMHQVVPCHSCHIGNQFTSTETECASCHSGDDIHQGSVGSSCDQCHTPNAWDIWQFNHDEHVGYALTGKHDNLSCDSCHALGSEPGDTSSVCGSCHGDQDIHNGRFGEHCGRCHGTTHFFELLIKEL